MTALPVVYSTSTPIRTVTRTHFDYPTKRDAYVDCSYAVLGLNRAAKSMPDNYRHAAYRLKVRWVEMLYKRGFCVQAYEEYGVWHLKFKIDGILFAWHIPDGVIHWQIKEMRGPVQFDYVEGLPLRKMGIQESIALIEWCLESKR